MVLTLKFCNMAAKSLLDSVWEWVVLYSSFLLLALLVIILLYLWIRVPSGLPPCPRWVLPGFAHSLMVKGDLFALFRRLRREHGDVFSFWIAGRLIIVINGFQNIKEVFIDDGTNISWRPDILNCDLFHYGVICTSGRHGREQRHVTKFALDRLHEKGLEQQIWSEFLALSSVLHRQTTPFNPCVLIQPAMYSSMCALLFGHRIDYSDPRITEGVSLLNDNIKLYSDARLPNFFPFEKFLIGDTFDTKFLRLNMADIYRKLIVLECDDHEQRGSGEQQDDFISIYMHAIKEYAKSDRETKEQLEREMKETGKKNTKAEEKPTTVNKVNMHAVAYDLLWHGTVTMAGALQWAILFLLHNPEVQTRARREIDDSFPLDTAPLTKEDRLRLPYLEAIVLEVHRLANVVPFAMAHSVLKEVKFHGYRIPTDAVVVPNLESVLMDPKIFKDPEVFNPERFLDATGCARTPAQYIPFFFGMRGCLGDKVAHLTVFLFLFGLLQNYELVGEENVKLPSLSRNYQVVSLPNDYKVWAVPRKLY